MDVKESINKLRQIRGWYERGGISMEMANSMGEKYVDIVNSFYRKKSKEYGICGKTIRKNVKFWPQ